MFRFLLTPRWIAFTLVCLALVPAFLQLSNWQWDRLHARQSLNTTLTTALSAAPIEIADLKLSAPDVVDPDTQWQTINLVGTWRNAEQVLVRKRSLESEAGFWVATPFSTTDGKQLIIVRGWTAAGTSALDTPVVLDAPAGETKLAARVRIVPARTNPAPTDLPSGQVDRIVPNEIISDSTFTNAYFELVASDPLSIGEDIRLLPEPEITEGPHRSYAMQWQFFTIMLFVGWAILVRNEVQSRKTNSDKTN